MTDENGELAAYIISRLSNEEREALNKAPVEMLPMLFAFVVAKYASEKGVILRGQKQRSPVCDACARLYQKAE